MRYQAQRASSGGPTRLCFHVFFWHTEKKQRTHHAHIPLARCLVRLLAVIGLFRARSLRSSWFQCLLFECTRRSIAYQQRPLAFQRLSFLPPQREFAAKTRDSAYPSLVAPRKALCTESLVFAVNSLWGGAPRCLSRPRENFQQQRWTQCTLTVCARTISKLPQTEFAAKTRDSVHSYSLRAHHLEAPC